MSVRLDKLLSSLGYCSRRETSQLVKSEAVLVNGIKAKSVDQKVDARDVTVNGEVLDPAQGILVMLHKPADYICSHDDSGSSVFELLPRRFSCRNPKLSCVGRLDKDTTGLLLLTDDGELLHRLTSPKHHVPKIYDVKLASDLVGNEAEIFASGTLMLEEEETPLKPVEMEVLSAREVRLTLHEGRYHQVKRMFLAVGNKVEFLHRSQVGPYRLEDLALGEWKFLDLEPLNAFSAAK